MSDPLDIIDTDLVKLDDVAERFFNVTPKIARRKAALNTLPVPAFRISGTQKGPFYLRRDDLTKHLERRYKDAKVATDQMAAAGAV